MQMRVHSGGLTEVTEETENPEEEGSELHPREILLYTVLSDVITYN